MLVNSIGEADSMKLEMNCMCTLTVEVRRENTSEQKNDPNIEVAEIACPLVHARCF